jgi:hypothetical protein
MATRPGWVLVASTVLMAVIPGPALAGTTRCDWKVSYPIVVNTTTIESLAVVDRYDVWAVGYSFDDARNFTALVEHWDGRAWSVTPTPDVGSSTLDDVVAFGADDAWAVGQAEGNPLALHWDGLAWTQVLVPGFFMALNTVSGISPTDIWAAGTQSLAVHWNGTLWTTEQVLDVATVYGISMAAPDDVWAVGTTGTYPSSPAAGHWDGTSWRNVPMPSGPLHSGQVTSVAALAEDRAWAVGDDFNGGDPYVFRWNGNRWGLNQPALDHTFLTGVAGRAPDDVWAVGRYDFFGGSPVAVHWSGGGWRSVPVPDLAGTAEYSDVALDPATTDAWVVGIQNFDPVVVRYVNCSV